MDVFADINAIPSENRISLIIYLQSFEGKTCEEFSSSHLSFLRQYSVDNYNSIPFNLLNKVH